MNPSTGNARPRSCAVEVVKATMRDTSERRNGVVLGYQDENERHLAESLVV